MKYLLSHREMLYLLLALLVCLFLVLLTTWLLFRKRHAYPTKVRMGENPITAKPHPSGFIPRDKQMSKERFVTRYEGIPSSVYQMDPKKKKRY